MKGRQQASIVALLLCLASTFGAGTEDSASIAVSAKGTKKGRNCERRALPEGEKNKSGKDGEKSKGKENTKNEEWTKGEDKIQGWHESSESSPRDEAHPSPQESDEERPSSATTADSSVPCLESDEAKPYNDDKSVVMVAPLVSEDSAPTQAPHVSEEVELNADASITGTPATATEYVPDVQCPQPGYYEFTMLKTSKPFIRYPLTKGNQTIVLSVTETCSYIVEDLSGTNDTVYSSSPLEWLDLVIHHFGGAPGNRKKGLKFSGAEIPSVLDIAFMEVGEEAFKVVIPSSSGRVSDSNLIAWVFRSEEDAKDFEYFLSSLVRYAPEIFLTNESAHCGSGPLCEIVGNSVCYHDPLNNNTLGILHLNGDEDQYDDAFAWFKDCVSGALDCLTDDTNNTFSYSPCPFFRVNNTNFTFTDDSNGSNEITFQCPTANSALLVTEFVQKLSIDPFHALSIGGPNEPGSHHHNRTTVCRG
jgi:hypothetical protein